MTDEAPQRRPFHETIVDAIHSASESDLKCLAKLIRETKIPKDHDAIITSWRQRLRELEISLRLGEDYYPYGVVEALREQKKEAEEKEKAKTKEQLEAVSS